MTRRSPIRRFSGIRKGLFTALLLAGLVSGCSTGKGVYHRVEGGQTAYRIAKVYGMDARTLLEANGITDPRTLRPGQMLWIPGATRTRIVPPRERIRARRSRLSGRKLVMPVRGTVSSGFGKRNGRMHGGMDILAPEGAKVRAAGYGVVLYAGNGMRGYGNAIVLDHGDGITTLYGHLKSYRVKSGDVVAAGSVIGAVGDTGNATTTHLHFEIRRNGKGVDPENYLE
jgi:murein DD-endopeptidase MepM/ murein hydrolase activator NlpD